MTKYEAQRTIYNKLVRDLIPSIIESNNQTYKSHIANEEEYREELHKKLLEEINEFIEEPCIDEIADILEVLEAIKKLCGFSDKDIEDAKKKKFEERGGFEKRMILEEVYRKGPDLMELWSLMDMNRSFNGRVIERGQIIDPGCFHLVVFAFIKNHKGQFLISQRASNKTHAHTWEIPAGASILEEDSLSAILREVKEEVGLVLEPKNGEIIKTFYRQGHSAYIGDIWLFNQTVDDSEIICGLNEVQKAKFADKQEIIELMRSDLFMVGMNEVLECIEFL